MVYKQVQFLPIKSFFLFFQKCMPTLLMSYPGWKNKTEQCLKYKMSKKNQYFSHHNRDTTSYKIEQLCIFKDMCDFILVVL